MKLLYIAADVDLTTTRGEASHVRSFIQAWGTERDSIVAVIHTTDAGALPTTPNRQIFAKPQEIAGQDWFLTEARRLIAQGGFDAIYERRFSSPLGPTLAMESGLPLFLEINGWPDTDVRAFAKFRARLRGIVAIPVRRWRFASATGIVVVTKDLGDRLQATYRVPEERILHLPNGVDVERFRTVDRRAARAELGVAPDEVIIVYLGSLAWWQGTERALEAFLAISPKARAKARFWIIGDGEQQGILESRVAGLPPGQQGQVRIFGAIPYDRVPTHLVAADIAVMTPDHRPIVASQLKMYEYLAASLPVVALAYPGLALLTDIGAGRLIDADLQTTGRQAAIATALNDLILDAKEREVAGRAGYEYALAHATWQGRMHDLRTWMSKRILEERGAS